MNGYHVVAYEHCHTKYDITYNFELLSLISVLHKPKRWLYRSKIGLDKLLLIYFLLKELSHTALRESRDNVNQFKESYDNLVAEDKLMEKEFRKEFNDVPGYIVDQLFRLFKKRPKFVFLLLVLLCFWWAYEAKRFL